MLSPLQVKFDSMSMGEPRFLCLVPSLSCNAVIMLHQPCKTVRSQKASRTISTPIGHKQYNKLVHNNPSFRDLSYGGVLNKIKAFVCLYLHHNNKQDELRCWLVYKRCSVCVTFISPYWLGGEKGEESMCHDGNAT